MFKYRNLKANRLEVIDGNGRSYVLWQDAPLNIVFDVQDGGRTLKIFVQNHKRDMTPNRGT